MTAGPICGGFLKSRLFRRLALQYQMVRNLFGFMPRHLCFKCPQRLDGVIGTESWNFYEDYQTSR